MNTLLAFFLFLLLKLTILNAMHIEPPRTQVQSNTLYDALMSSCVNLNLQDKLFKSQEIFEKCKNWQKINNTKSLTQESVQDVLCLLYYDSFMSFCTEFKRINITNTPNNLISYLVPDVKNYQVNKICENLSLFPPGKLYEHNIDKIINGEGICYKLCANFDKSPVHECGLAYYFTTFNFSQLIQVPVQSSNLPSNPLENKSENKAEPPKQQTQNSTKGAGLPPVAPNIVNAQSIPPKPQLSGDSTSGRQSKQNEVEIQADGNGKEKPPPVQAQEPQTPKETPPQNTQDEPAVDQNNPYAVSENTLNVTKPKLQPVVTSNNVQVPNTDIDPLASKDKTEKVEIKVTPAKSIPDQNPQDVPGNDQPQVDGGKDETEDQGNSLVPPEQMMGETDDEDEGNNYKEEDENPVIANVATVEEKKEKPSTLNVAGELPANYNTAEDLDGESYFFSYFMVICVLFVLGYVGYHNRQKVMALMLEGKRGRRQTRGRRPNSANYHKLDSNLEEAISSTCSKNTSHVIY